MLQNLRLTAPALALFMALAGPIWGCGGGDEGGTEAPATEEQTAAAEAAALDPAAVEASVEEFLANDEYAGSLSASVDCDDGGAEAVDCTITGDRGLEGAVTASPSQGFAYTGEIEGPDGPSSLGGSASEGTITDPAAVEESLNGALADNAGEPTADCPDSAGEESLECEVSGDGVSGTLTVTPTGGFEWEGTIETADGTRSIGANELP